MALEKFNTTTKAQVFNDWYPEESKSYLRFFVVELQKELGISKNTNILRKTEIKKIVKHFGKPFHISDQDYIDYVNRLKLLDEW